MDINSLVDFYNSPAQLKEFLDSKNMAMQKKFGQNFMINGDARKKIAEQLDVSENTKVWEIGPGLGCMTWNYLTKGADVTVFEIDRGFIACLHEFYKDFEDRQKFKIIEGDCLKTWKKIPAQNGMPQRVCGNLPYNIAATFIADTITEGMGFERCVWTVQKEVAERMCAKANTENYSAFSVLCQWAYDVKLLNVLGAGNFWPKPNVASQAVLFTKKEKPLECSNPKYFVSLVHALFSARRKTIHNNIKQVMLPDVDADSMIIKAGLSPNDRAESLSVKQLLILSETILANKK